MDNEKLEFSPPVLLMETVDFDQKINTSTTVNWSIGDITEIN